VHRLGERLAHAGHDVTVLSFSPPPADAVYRHITVRGRIDRSKIARIFAGSMALKWFEPKFVTNLGIDVLHLHGDDWFYFGRSVPTVRTFHGSALGEAVSATTRRRRLYQLTMQHLEKLSARLATISYAGSTDAAAIHSTEGRLPYGVDIPAVPAVAKSEKPSILFVGTWDGRKRGRFLKSVFDELVLPEMRDAELWMVSDKAEEGRQVHWLGTPSDDELTRLYQRAWVFCMPSTYEGFGIPYIEAMANWTPVVASPNPGSRLILANGKHGVIATDDKLGRVLLALLKDGEARARWAEAGRARARDFRWDAVIGSHEKAYAEAVRRFRKGGATRPLSTST
jgi:phosphatidyl-myo-inositol alpha-mannosyltransferase